MTGKRHGGDHSKVSLSTGVHEERTDCPLHNV